MLSTDDTAGCGGKKVTESLCFEALKVILLSLQFLCILPYRVPIVGATTHVLTSDHSMQIQA